MKEKVRFKKEGFCKYCGKSFKLYHSRHIYCSKSCKEDSRILRVKGKRVIHRRVLEENIFPSFVCSHCGKKNQLDFDPLVHPEKFQKFKCPSCNKTRDSDDY